MVLVCLGPVGCLQNSTKVTTRKQGEEQGGGVLSDAKLSSSSTPSSYCSSLVPAPEQLESAMILLWSCLLVAAVGKSCQWLGWALCLSSHSVVSTLCGNISGSFFFIHNLFNASPMKICRDRWYVSDTPPLSPPPQYIHTQSHIPVQRHALELFIQVKIHSKTLWLVGKSSLLRKSGSLWQLSMG